MNDEAQNDARIAVVLSVFSPRAFFESAQGTPFLTPQAETTVTCELPSTGVHFVEPGIHGCTHDAWIRGLVTRSRERARFIETVRTGLIPSPISAQAVASKAVQVHYIDPAQAHGSHTTVANLLGISDALVSAALASPLVRCPTCGDPSDVFPTPNQLVREIHRAWSSHEIIVTLHGISSEVTLWSESHGFTPLEDENGNTTVRLLSTRCTEESCREIIPLLRSTRTLPSAWLSVRSGDSQREYYWHGRCRRCARNMPPFKQSAARGLVERGDSSAGNNEGGRELAGISLHEVLRRPLQEIVSTNALSNLINPIPPEWIEILSLEHISLATIVSSLSPQSLIAVILLAHALHNTEGGQVRIVDLPLAAIPQDKRQDVLLLAHEVTHSAPLVWITEHPKSSARAPSVVRSTHNGVHLGTLHFPAHQLLSLTTGTLAELHLSASNISSRPSTLALRAILGDEQSDATFKESHPCVPHLVPLFPRERLATKLVAHELGIIEPLAKLYAASHHARTLGLSPRDFVIGQTRRPQGVCETCLGTGLAVRRGDNASEIDVSPCTACWGTRFRSPTREVLFRGKALWELLNNPLQAIRETIQALPGMRKVLDVCTHTELLNVPIGLPVQLLSRQEARRLLIARAMIQGSPRRPAVIILEEPGIDCFAASDRDISRLVQLKEFADRVAWISATA